MVFAGANGKLFPTGVAGLREYSAHRAEFVTEPAGQGLSP
jgi:hypothetical protein